MPHARSGPQENAWATLVLFRDEKTLLGIGQAQVRDPTSVESAPALMVASYAMLLVAAQRAFPESRDGLLPQPKWAANNQPSRVSTQQLIHQLRAEVWGPRAWNREFLRLGCQRLVKHEAGEMLIPYRIGRVLCQQLILKGPKSRDPLKSGSGASPEVLLTSSVQAAIVGCCRPPHRQR